MKITGRIIQQAILFLENDLTQGGKYNYAKKRNLEALEPFLKQIKQEISKLEIENALTDPTTKEILVTVNGGFKWSVEGLNKKNDGVKAIYDKEYDVEIYSFPITKDSVERILEFINSKVEFLLPETLLSFYYNSETFEEYKANAISALA